MLHGIVKARIMEINKFRLKVLPERKPDFEDRLLVLFHELACLRNFLYQAIKVIESQVNNLKTLMDKLKK